MKCRLTEVLSITEESFFLLYVLKPALIASLPCFNNLSVSARRHFEQRRSFRPVDEEEVRGGKTEQSSAAAGADGAAPSLNSTRLDYPG